MTTQQQKPASLVVKPCSSLWIWQVDKPCLCESVSLITTSVHLQLLQSRQHTRVSISSLLEVLRTLGTQDCFGAATYFGAAIHLGDDK